MAPDEKLPADGVQVIRHSGACLELLDQRELPVAEHWIRVEDVDTLIDAIGNLVVRGAPAIGIAGAWGAVIATRRCGGDLKAWHGELERIVAARPTAVNLRWAIERMRRVADEAGGVDAERLATEARAIHREDIDANRAMAAAGAAEIAPGSGVLTHCNTGSLATGGIGTALGVIARGWREGVINDVYAGETRPWLQGSRLTAWELARLGIPFRVIVDSAAGALMASGAVQWVITGADRIAANGDVANKVGTYSLAVLARHHGLGFMVVAPSSTLDPAISSGRDIPIENRGQAEIWSTAGLDRTPPGYDAWNPVFDVTPASLVDCIVTERGVHRRPYDFTHI